MKRYFSFLIVIVLLFSVFSPAFADDIASQNTITSVKQQLITAITELLSLLEAKLQTLLSNQKNAQAQSTLNEDIAASSSIATTTATSSVETTVTSATADPFWSDFFKNSGTTVSKYNYSDYLANNQNNSNNNSSNSSSNSNTSGSSKSSNTALIVGGSVIGGAAIISALTNNNSSKSSSSGSSNSSGSSGSSSGGNGGGQNNTYGFKITKVTYCTCYYDPGVIIEGTNLADNQTLKLKYSPWQSLLRANYSIWTQNNCVIGGYNRGNADCKNTSGYTCTNSGTSGDGTIDFIIGIGSSSGGSCNTSGNSSGSGTSGAGGSGGTGGSI